jgi:hypothetical protein
MKRMMKPASSFSPVDKITLTCLPLRTKTGCSAELASTNMC